MRTHLSKIEDYPAFLETCWQEHLKPREPDAPTVISLFAGCGGSSLGYSMAGYRELLAVEWDDHAVETFKLNFPGVPVWHGDIAGLSVEECLRITGLKPGELDVLDGSHKSRCRSRNYTWAELMRRVWSIDVLQCPQCGGRMRILAAIHPPLCAPAHNGGYVFSAVMLS